MAAADEGLEADFAAAAAAGCPRSDDFNRARPGAAVPDDDALLDDARRTGGIVLHPTSTCRMGTDPGAVVDPDLRVRGRAA